MTTATTHEVPMIFYDVDAMVDWFIDRDTLPTIEEIETAAVRLGRNSYPELINGLQINLSLPDDVLAYCVPDAWQMCEFPFSKLAADEWEGLFDCAGFTIDGVRAPRPDQVPVLYRGAAPEHRDGWSWTPDRDLAQWFADRFAFDGNRKVYATQPDPWQVLAVMTGTGDFGREGESEWIVRTDGLRIEEVEV